MRFIEEFEIWFFKSNNFYQIIDYIEVLIVNEIFDESYLNLIFRIRDFFIVEIDDFYNDV